MSIRVLASVIEQGDRILLCERPAHKRHGGLWEFPGGKVERGESDFEAAARELKEELAVEVLDVDPVEFSVRDPGSHFVIEFLRVKIRGEPLCLEHASISWVTPNELLRLSLAPSDRKYAQFRFSGNAVTDRAEL